MTKISGYWRANSGKYTLLLLIACGSAMFLLAGLGSQYLWQDEAMTALVGKTILTGGVPRGYDGKNFFSQERGAEYGDNYIWRWQSWLPYYVAAGFYKIFGVSTFVSRLPFALFGIGTVILTFFFAESLWPGTRIGVIAAALLTISVPFLLLCRQCQYYSMAMFFSVLSLYAYVMLMHNKKYAAITLFVSSTLLFHSQHFYIAVFFAAALLHAAVFNRRLLKSLLSVIIITILVNIPWLIWFGGMKYQQTYSNRTLSLALLIIINFVTDIARYVFPLWLAAVVLIIAFVNKIRNNHFLRWDRSFWEKLTLPIFFAAFNILVLAVISPWSFFRYIAPSIPLLIVLIAVIIDAAVKAHLLLAVATVAVLLATSRLSDFLYEITHTFDSPSKGIACYLNEHGSADDIAAVTYGDMPLKFYTKMRIIGGLTGEDLEPAKNARWVIIRKYVICDKDKAVKKFLLNNINWTKYRRIKLNSPDTPWDNREELATHYFRTRTNEDKVIIYERTD